MNMINHTPSALGSITALALAMLATGCASSRPTQTGYLPDYDRLHAVDSGTRLQAATIQSWSPQQTIEVKPTTWAVSADPDNGISPSERAEMLRIAQEAFAEAIRPFQPAVPDAMELELRSEITRIDGSNPAVNVVTTLALFVPVDNGGVCIEWKLVDARSGRVMAEGVATSVGKPWNVLSSFRETGHARAGIKAIAHDVAAYLASGQHS